MAKTMSEQKRQDEVDWQEGQKLFTATTTDFDTPEAKMQERETAHLLNVPGQRRGPLGPAAGGPERWLGHAWRNDRWGNPGKASSQRFRAKIEAKKKAKKDRQEAARRYGSTRTDKDRSSSISTGRKARGGQCCWCSEAQDASMKTFERCE